MAKKPAAATAVALFADYPADLAKLLAGASEALKLLAAGATALDTAATPEEKATVTANLVEVTSVVEAANAAIEGWVVADIDQRLKAAAERCDAERENLDRDLEAALKVAIERSEAELAELKESTDRQLAEMDADLKQKLRAASAEHADDSAGLVTCWAVQLIHLDGELKQIGAPLQLPFDTYLQLQARGDVTDTDPSALAEAAE